MPTGQHLVYVSSRELLNALPAHAALLSPDGEIKAVNTAWAEFAEQNGLRMPQYGVGVNYFEVCEATQGPDRDLSLEVARGIHELRRGLPATFSLQYPCHSPTQRRWYLLNATRLGPQSPGPVLTLHEDITPLVLNQERLISINSELARVALFLSQDVGAPLHTMQSYVQLIRRNVGHLLEHSTAEYFEMVSAMTSRLSAFATEALHLALLGHQYQLPKEPLDLDVVVQEAMERTDALIKEYGATVQADPLGRAMGNFPYLVQLFQNLIANALLHSGPHVRVHMGVRWREGRKLYFVQDFGPDVPAQFREVVFLPVSRSSTSGIGDTGLALALCRHIVEQHGGRLFVEAQLGQGSTFYFSLGAHPNGGEGYEQTRGSA